MYVPNICCHVCLYAPAATRPHMLPQLLEGCLPLTLVCNPVYMLHNCGTVADTHCMCQLLRMTLFPAGALSGLLP